MLQSADKTEPPVTLSYEPLQPGAVGRGPRWVVVVGAIYGLILLGLASLPVLQSALSGDSVWLPLVVAGTVFVAAELGLLLTPIRVGQRRPISRRSLLIPILATSALLAILGLAAGMAIHEWVKMPDFPLWLTASMVLILWGTWTFVFWILSGRREPASFGGRLHRWIYAGSVLELLIAVPAHVVCRRRSECCAGIESGIGLCLGVAVMLVAFGPSIVFLYYRRWRQIAPRS
ncbi:MAG: hypothetical protein ABSH20_14230 [Tepidisphaeraceae bacterium]|jgi:hypothetical protein